MRMVVSGFATHMMRVMPPNLTARVAACVDNAVRDMLQSRLGVRPADGLAFRQCLLPISEGGIGLPHASAVAPLAFVAGAAQAPLAFVAGAAQAAPLIAACGTQRIPRPLASGWFDHALATSYSSLSMLAATDPTPLTG